MSTPFFALYDALLSYHDLHTFGCKCYPNLTATTTHKLAPRSSLCAFLGYSHDHKGYRCLNLATNRVIISRHVVFDETTFPFAQHRPTSASQELNFLTNDDSVQDFSLTGAPGVSRAPPLGFASPRPTPVLGMMASRSPSPGPAVPPLPSSPTRLLPDGHPPPTPDPTRTPPPPAPSSSATEVPTSPPYTAPAPATLSSAVLSSAVPAAPLPAALTPAAQVPAAPTSAAPASPNPPPGISAPAAPVFATAPFPKLSVVHVYSRRAPSLMIHPDAPTSSHPRLATLSKAPLSQRVLSPSLQLSTLTGWRLAAKLGFSNLVLACTPRYSPQFHAPSVML
jgi:hypothetical protein